MQFRMRRRVGFELLKLDLKLKLRYKRVQAETISLEKGYTV